MRTSSIFAVLMLVAGATAPAQGRQDSPNRNLVLSVAIQGYGSGGRSASTAGITSDDRLESYVWTDRELCSAGASSSAPSTNPAGVWVGWHLTGTVLEDTPGQMTVRVNWQRLWDNGSRVQNGQSGTQTFTLRSAERVELDRVSPQGSSRCGATEARLEASVMTRAQYLMSTYSARGGAMAAARGAAAGGVGGRGRGTGASAMSGSQGASGSGTTGAVVQGRGGRGMGAGGDSTATTTARGGAAGRGRGATGGFTPGAAATSSAGGGGRGSGAVTGTMRGGDQTTTVMGRGGRGAGVGSGVGAVAGAGGAGIASRAMTGRGGPAAVGQSYDAEIWLVHKMPDGKEEVQQQTIRFSGMSRNFSFPPVQVNGSGGPITIDISGQLQVTGSNQNRYYLATSRGDASTYMLGTRGGRGRGSADPANASENETPRIAVSLARQARRASPFVDTRGTTDMSIQIPQPNDVLSFELPPLQKQTEDLLKGHVFSVRLRITSVK